ncbi:tyrosine-type recombinase/integrase [Paenibacillus sp. sptzw28]|uniref:tyrosine-type recombinase/integrase n=1 Tax=Paenibacillus sp. sptzw28 TaxID=715179 RepID=UPI002163B0C6|nr:tyrosine-type recombinase/integrase [Paenibacillus sp. sptzw28]
MIEEDVIHLKISCESPREYAMLEFLYSTGCRVGEVQKLDIEDINLENCSAIVNDKGAKQREIYFTTECKIWIKRYLESRDPPYRFMLSSFVENGEENCTGGLGVCTNHQLMWSSEIVRIALA